MDDERYYQQVLNELRSSGKREALWLMSLTAAGGDDKAANVYYIKTRVEQLKQEEMSHLNEERAKLKNPWKCPKCGAINQYWLRKCVGYTIREDGAKIKCDVTSAEIGKTINEIRPTTKCPQCGKIVSGEDRFCRACGIKLS